MSWHKDGRQLSSRQSARGAHHRRAGPHFTQGRRRLHLRRSRAGGRSQSRGALPSLPRPRRANGRRRASRLRALYRSAQRCLGRRTPRSPRRARAAWSCVPSVRSLGAGVFLRHVRIRSVVCRSSRAARGGRARVRGIAQGLRGRGGHGSGCAQAPGDDDGVACLVGVAWHRRRCSRAGIRRAALFR